VKPIGLQIRHHAAIYVNPALISYFRAADDAESGSVVYLNDGSRLVVAESPNEILELLARHRDSVKAEDRDGFAYTSEGR